MSMKRRRASARTFGRAIIVLIGLHAISARACTDSAYLPQVSRNFIIEVRFEGTPVSNASVSLLSRATSPGRNFGPYKTDSNGRIVLTEFPEGEFSAVYERGGLSAYSAFSVVAFPNASHESLVTLDWNWTFLTARQFRGAVFGLFGNLIAQKHPVPQRNIDIQVRSLTDTRLARTVHVDRNGRFENDLPEGMYVARVPLQIPHPSRPDLFTTGNALIPIKISQTSSNESLSIGIKNSVCGIHPYEQLQVANK